MDQHICYGSTKRRRSSEILSKALWRPGHKDLPPSLDYRKQPSFSLHDFSFVSMSRFKELLIREGKELKIRKKQAVKSGLGARSCFPINGYMQYLWTILQILKTLWVKVNDWVMVCCSQSCRPQRSWTKTDDNWLLLTLTPTHQKNINELITPSLKSTINFSIIFSYLEHTVLRTLACCAPFVWQSNRYLFLLHPKLWFKIQFWYWCREKPSFQD